MFFTYSLLVIFLMLLFNAVFAAYEMALASVSQTKLCALAQENKQGAKDALFMKYRIEGSLAVIQVGITLVGAVAAAVGGAGSDEAIAPYLIERFSIPQVLANILALALFIIPLTLITIIFGELVPKTFALKRREWVCLKLSPPMRSLYVVFSPLVSFIEKTVKSITARVTEKIGVEEGYDIPNLHELKAAASMARASMLIGAHEEKIVLSAVQLSQRKVADIMGGADEISMIPVTDTLSDALSKACLDMHTRFPLCETVGDPQTIIGYLNFKDIVSALKTCPGNPSVKGITRPIKRLSAEMPLSQALSLLMREKIHIAIATSADQRVVGMITLEDIIEDFLGEIEDEFDRLPNYIQPVGSGYIAGGAAPITTIASTVGVELAFEEISGRTPNLAEWVVQKLGREVKAGEIISTDNFSITVRKLQHKKLAEALISKDRSNQ